MWWAAAFGWAAPPAGVDPQDLGRWETGSQALLAGPAGCWELSGRVELTAASYTPASRLTRGGRSDHRFAGSFAGRIDEGTWSSFAYDLSPVDKPGEPAEIDFPVFPSVGRIAESVPTRTNPHPDDETDITVSTEESEEAFNLLNRLLEEFAPSTATSYAEWHDGDQALHLLQDVPVSDGARADTITLETAFPGGGPATKLDAIFPRKMRMGDGPIKVSVFDGQLHLRGQKAGERVLPALDSLSFGLGALGFTFAYEQKLVFERAVPCESR